MPLSANVNTNEASKFALDLQNNTCIRILSSVSDSPANDAFGRLRVSNPETLFDSKNIFNDPDLAETIENQPLFYDNQETDGSGTSTLPQSAVSFAIGKTANTVTNGYDIAGGFVESGGVSTGSGGSDRGALNNAIRLGSTIAGVSDTIVLTATPIGGSSDVDIEGSLTFRELV